MEACLHIQKVFALNNVSRPTDFYSLSHTHNLSPSLSLTHSHTHTKTHTLYFSHSLTHIHRHTYTHTQPLSLFLSLFNTHTFSRTHTFSFSLSSTLTPFLVDMLVHFFAYVCVCQTFSALRRISFNELGNFFCKKRSFLI